MHLPEDDILPQGSYDTGVRVPEAQDVLVHSIDELFQAVLHELRVEECERNLHREWHHAQMKSADQARYPIQRPDWSKISYTPEFHQKPAEVVVRAASLLNGSGPLGILNGSSRLKTYRRLHLWDLQYPAEQSQNPD